MFLFDADSLILANRHDFPIDRDPGTFWNFLEDMGKQGQIRIPEAVFEEIRRGDDRLSTWLSARKKPLFVPTKDALPRIGQVLAAYGQVTDIDLEKLHADPCLIAHAWVMGATIVTNETSRPGATSMLKRKIPDVCSRLGVACMRYPRFLWEMKP